VERLTVLAPALVGAAFNVADAWLSATAWRVRVTKAGGWGTDLVSVPPALRRAGAEVREEGPVPRGPVPRPRRNGCNRTRSTGNADRCRPHGRTPSVHRSRRTPWLSRPVSRVEGARRSVSLGVTRCFDNPARGGGEEWTRAPREQARSGVGMEVLDVLAPGAGASRTRVGVDPADHELAGFRHGTPPPVVRTTEVSADWGIPFLGRKTYLLRSFVADARMPVSIPRRRKRMGVHLQGVGDPGRCEA
jgi:hypothetical protein